MPKPLNWYGCEYRCGFRSTDYEDVKTHENSCSLNPNNLYCEYCEYKGEAFFGSATCRKYNRSIYACGMNHWNAWKCKECLDAQKQRIEKGEA
jgi:hypothetical protein